MGIWKDENNITMKIWFGESASIHIFWGKKNYIPKILSKAISYIHISYYWDEFGDRLYQENTET